MLASRTCVDLQQSCSSLLSPQLLIPLQTKMFDIQSPLSHSNCDEEQATRERMSVIFVN